MVIMIMIVCFRQLKETEHKDIESNDSVERSENQIEGMRFKLGGGFGMGDLSRERSSTRSTSTLQRDHALIQFGETFFGAFKFNSTSCCQCVYPLTVYNFSLFWFYLFIHIWFTFSHLLYHYAYFRRWIWFGRSHICKSKTRYSRWMQRDAATSARYPSCMWIYSWRKRHSKTFNYVPLEISIHVDMCINRICIKRKITCSHSRERKKKCSIQWKDNGKTERTRGHHVTLLLHEFTSLRRFEWHNIGLEKFRQSRFTIDTLSILDESMTLQCHTSMKDMRKEEKFHSSNWLRIKLAKKEREAKRTGVRWEPYQ